MITIISATNRADSNTKKIALIYQQTIAALGGEAQILDLVTLQTTTRDEAFNQLEAELLIPTTKYILISPEYNGTFTGILKLLIDISDVRKVWHGKKAMLVGVATGRAGNLRGMDQLTNVMNHLKVNVLANKVPLSSVQNELDTNGQLINETTKAVVENQIKEFLQF
jgi:chromate reductase, NAD(P)H dehydrogenase (quinone)